MDLLCTMNLLGYFIHNVGNQHVSDFHSDISCKSCTFKYSMIIFGYVALTFSIHINGFLRNDVQVYIC